MKQLMAGLKCPAFFIYNNMDEASRIRQAAWRARFGKVPGTQPPSPQQKKEAVEIIRQREQRARIRPRAVFSAPTANTIILTGGIGDVFALESFFPETLRTSLKTILYATHKSGPLQQLFQALPNYSSLQEQRVIWNDFKHFWCFCHKDEIRQRLQPSIPADFNVAEDWGIITKFPLIAAGGLKYSYSSFLQHKLIDIERFQLPVNYIAIQPYSSDKRLAARDFATDDWQLVRAWLRARNLKGVVINQGPEAVPTDDNLIDLTNRTTIVEAVEVLKKAKGYIGIDSCFTVLAAKLFPNEWLAIKSNNSHCYENKHIYFTPKVSYEFLATDFAKILRF